MKNRKIKLAVVGIGVMGLKHIDAISKTCLLYTSPSPRDFG